MMPSSGNSFFRRPHHARDQAVGVGASLPSGVFRLGSMAGNSAMYGDAQGHAFLGHGQQQIQRQALHAGHGGHGFAAVVAFVHEHRVDEVVGRQPVLAHQVAGEGIAAQAAGAVGGKGVGLDRCMAPLCACPRKHARDSAWIQVTSGSAPLGDSPCRRQRAQLDLARESSPAALPA